MKDFTKATSLFEVNRMQADLDSAIAFVGNVLDVGETKLSRNIERARATYDGALHFLAHTTLSQREEIEITRKLAELKAGLWKLGEKRS